MKKSCPKGLSVYIMCWQFTSCLNFYGIGVVWFLYQYRPPPITAPVVEAGGDGSWSVRALYRIDPVQLTVLPPSSDRGEWSRPCCLDKAITWNRRMRVNFSALHYQLSCSSCRWSAAAMKRGISTRRQSALKLYILLNLVVDLIKFLMLSYKKLLNVLSFEANWFEFSDLAFEILQHILVDTKSLYSVYIIFLYP